MLGAALDLARQGWNVLPCREGGDKAKAPYLPHGFHDASRDEDVIRAWWTRWPGAMVGAVVPDTLLVLDVDPRNGGSVAELERVLGPLPDTLTVTSGRGDGGVHLYYLRPAGELVSTRLPAGVDLKKSGYCIVPPSLHPATGRPYTWNDALPAALPGMAVAQLRPAPRIVRRAPQAGRGDRFAGLFRQVAQAAPTRRNNTLFWAACRAVDEGAGDDVFARLVDLACATGLPPHEAQRTVASARRKEQAS